MSTFEAESAPPPAEPAVLAQIKLFLQADDPELSEEEAYALLSPVYQERPQLENALSEENYKEVLQLIISLAGSQNSSANYFAETFLYNNLDPIEAKTLALEGEDAEISQQALNCLKKSSLEPYAKAALNTIYKIQNLQEEKRQKEFELLSEEEKIAYFRKVARDYYDHQFQSSSEGLLLDTSDPAFNDFERCKKALSPAIYNQIIDQEVMASYNLPQSLQISEIAMRRLESTFSHHRMVDYSQNPLSLLDFPELNDPEDIVRIHCRNPFNHTFLVAFKEDKADGLTIYEVVEEEGEKIFHIVFQYGKNGSPGIGIYMLKEVISRAIAANADKVALETAHIPRGLGNLGFTYVEGLGRGIFYPAYECQLNKESEE